MRLRSVLPWFSAGLAIRLLFMPIAMHSDLVFIHYFPSFLSLKGIVDIYGYFGNHFLSAGFTYYPPLLYFVIGAFQRMFLASQPAFAPWIAHVHAILYNGVPTSFKAYQELTRSDLLPLIFAMKIPYLCADAACLWLAWIVGARLFPGGRTARRWWLDPVLFISTYLIGQYRIIPCAAVWLAIFFATRGRRHAVFFALGLAALFDSYPLFLLIPAVFILETDLRGRFAGVAIFGAVFLTVMGPLWVSSGGLVRYAYLSPVIRTVASGSITLHYAQPVAIATKLILAAVYIFFLSYLFLRRDRLASLSDGSRTKLWSYSSALLLLTLFATSRISFHYFMWLLPFWVVVREEGEPWPATLSTLAVVFLTLFCLDRPELNLGLFMPLDTRLGDFPSLHEVLGRYVPWGTVVALCRLAFSALCLSFSWALFSRRIQPLLERPPSNV